ncbi:MAG: ATP-binding cassette domain-containing protein [Traorella sp.]
MLQIQQISKQYKTDNFVQQALDKVSLNLRENEFVAILGPSGSGKTTLLNIIGGLDRYDSGDLIINGISTKNYSDRDWDSYRNHTIGFVFQSYNLIPHQSVLSNVELALTISGVSKTERKKRAIEALKEVGLGDHIYKRPNQLSGGQMQRVAIARALVNDPDILLADEPTGALDTTTSVQVMDLLQEVAKDRLVVMVTHNPELAEQYATRIVKLRDGKIIDDSDPFEVSETSQPPVYKNMGKSSMSILTATSLSLNNLLTKKGRTLLTAFAGSIGIIGIALILSLSTGFQNYIDQIQEDTLTSYPLTLTSETADVTSALLQMVSDKSDNKQEGIVKENQVLGSMFSKVGNNDLPSFIKYLNQNQDEIGDSISVMQYSYNVNPLIYIKNEYGITQVNPNTLLSSISGTSGMISSMQSATSSIFNEMIDNQEALESQYDVLAGHWPTAYNEMILVLNDPNTISDLLVYSLGLRDQAELQSIISSIFSNKPYETTDEAKEFTYEDFLNIEYKLIDATDTYRYNEKYDIYEDMSKDKAFMEKVYENAESLKIVGVVCAKEGSTSMALSNGVAYTKELTQHVIEKASQSEIVKKQQANHEINVFSGKRFDDEDNSAGLDFQDMITVDQEALSKAFGGNISQENIAQMTQGYMGKIASAVNADTSEAQNAINQTMSNLLHDMLTQYINENKTIISVNDSLQINMQKALNELLAYLQTNYPDIVIDETILQSLLQQIYDQIQNSGINGEIECVILSNSQASDLIDQYMQTSFAQQQMAQLSKTYLLPTESFTAIFKGFLNGYFQLLSQMMDDQIILTQEMVDPTAQLYIGIMELSDVTPQIAIMMSETIMRTSILSEVGNLMGELTTTIANSMNVDPQAIANAFQFNLSEEELSRLMSTLTSSGIESNYETNLATLGYQDLDNPTMISFYFKDFESKEEFINFLDGYNDLMEKEDDNKVIKYSDLTGILMSSMSIIVDSVSYVLIAFVSISLIVSSIMIGIITYISVLERTKEIGVLRAIGASKKNISSIFNAETFIIGLCSGLIGIGITLLLNPIINGVIHKVTGNLAINAVLPIVSASILVILSVLLTLISGFIPSKQAARKDPVTALRSE